MNFSDALNAMKTGSQVRRVGWGVPPATPVNAGSTLGIGVVSVEGQSFQMMLARLSDGSVVPFGGSQLDILSDDWEIIE